MGQINVAVPYKSKIILYWINSIKATTKVSLGLGMGLRRHSEGLNQLLKTVL